MKRFTGYIGALAFVVFVVTVTFGQEYGINWTRSAYHISANGVYIPTFSTTALNTFNMNVSNAGTSWVITVETQESTPKILWRWVTADAVGNFSIKLPVGILMTSGILVRATGTTAGVADVELTHRGAPNPSATPFTTQTPSSTATATSTPTPTPTPP